MIWVGRVRNVIVELSTTLSRGAPTKRLEQNTSRCEKIELIKNYEHPSVAVEAA